MLPYGYLNLRVTDYTALIWSCSYFRSRRFKPRLSNVNVPLNHWEQGNGLGKM